MIRKGFSLRHACLRSAVDAKPSVARSMEFNVRGRDAWRARRTDGRGGEYIVPLRNDCRRDPDKRCDDPQSKPSRMRSGYFGKIHGQIPPERIRLAAPLRYPHELSNGAV